MRTRPARSIIRFAMLALALIAVGCKHPVANTTAPPTAPPPALSAHVAPPPAQPTVTLQASPPIVQSGQSVTLQWSSTNATTLTLAPGLGGVAPEGSTTTTPTASTTYTITANGPGGTAESSAHVTVTAAAAPPAAAPSRRPRSMRCS